MKDYQWLITPIISALSVIAGVMITSIFNIYNTNKQRKWEKTKSEEKEAKDKEELKKKIYNKILLADSEFIIFDDVPPYSFDFELYGKEIKPILYEYLHHLDIEVVDAVRKLDFEIRDYRKRPKVDDEDLRSVGEEYEKLINTIVDLCPYTVYYATEESDELEKV